MSDDLAHARVWIQNGDEHHKRTKSAYQTMSHFVRQGIYECANLRMTSGRIKQRLLHVYDKSLSLSVAVH